MLYLKHVIQQLFNTKERYIQKVLIILGYVHPVIALIRTYIIADKFI